MLEVFGTFALAVGAAVSPFSLGRLRVSSLQPLALPMCLINSL